MSIHISAVARPKPDTIQELRDARAAGVTLESTTETMIRGYESVGEYNSQASFHVADGLTDNGETITDLQIAATGRYTKNGVRYVTAPGIVLNFDSVLDALAELFMLVE